MPELPVPVVETITVPVGPAAYQALKSTFQPATPGALTWPLTVGGHAIQGRWAVVGLREDYAIEGNRTYWVRLEWRAA